MSSGDLMKSLAHKNTGTDFQTLELSIEPLYRRSCIANLQNYRKINSLSILLSLYIFKSVHLHLDVVLHGNEAEKKIKHNH